MRKSAGARSLRQTLDFCPAVLFVLVMAGAAFEQAVVIKKTADRAAARHVIDTLMRNICTHPVVGCRVT
jgi:hypothetical protein